MKVTHYHIKMLNEIIVPFTPSQYHLAMHHIKLQAKKKKTQNTYKESQ